MQRRRYLLGVAGLAGSLAGCRSLVRPTDTSRSDAAAGRADAVVSAPPRPTFGDVSLPVPRSKLVPGAALGSIPAIVDPAFARDWSDLEQSLGPRDLVIGVRRGERARAYPLSLVSIHEAVNDVFASEVDGATSASTVTADDRTDEPILVTYCPLCASGVVMARTIDGEPSRFSASGYLFRSNLVLYDHRTGSLWSQLMATAIHGSATGDELPLVPSSLTTWRRWREANPETEVLRPPPESRTETAPLDQIPPAGSRSSGHVGVRAVALDADGRLPPRELVVGVIAGSATRAYPLSAVRANGVINDWVGDLPVVVAADPIPQAYVRAVNGEVLTFTRAGAGLLRGGGSTWSLVTGEARSGPHAGTTLTRATATTAMYWFAWSDFHPETTVYRDDRRSSQG